MVVTSSNLEIHRPLKGFRSMIQALCFFSICYACLYACFLYTPLQKMFVVNSLHFRVPLYVRGHKTCLSFKYLYLLSILCSHNSLLMDDLINVKIMHGYDAVDFVYSMPLLWMTFIMWFHMLWLLL